MPHSNRAASALLSSSITPNLPQQRRRWRWLAVSVAVNLVLGGLILAWVLGMPPRPPSGSWQREVIPTLSASDAAIVEDAVKRIGDIKMQGDIQSHEGWAKLHGILEAEPLDVDALTAQMDDMNRIRVEQSTGIGQTLMTELRALSPDGRAKLVVLMKRLWSRWQPPPR
jgi:hypothetical protein